MNRVYDLGEGLTDLINSGAYSVPVNAEFHLIPRTYPEDYDAGIVTTVIPASREVETISRNSILDTIQYQVGVERYVTAQNRHNESRVILDLCDQIIAKVLFEVIIKGNTRGKCSNVSHTMFSYENMLENSIMTSLLTFTVKTLP